MKIQTQCYGEMNIIESEFWGETYDGGKITSIFTMNKRGNELTVDLYINDVLLIQDVPLSDVRNELDYRGVYYGDNEGLHEFLSLIK